MKFIIYIVFLGSIIFSLYACGGDHHSVYLAGRVVDSSGNKIEDATVRIQGTNYSTQSDSQGRFELIAPSERSHYYLTAWKSEFYNGGVEVSATETDYTITLKPVIEEDDPDYLWLAPLRTGSTSTSSENIVVCENCHPFIAAEWQGNAHANSAVNPLFFAFYDGLGTDAPLGYKIDFPDSDGSCAACHVPTLALDTPYNASPHPMDGMGTKGIFCDFCHKIKDVNIDTAGAYPGIRSIVMNRPGPDHQIFYGPYDDVFPGDDSYNPLYKESGFCAPCHSGHFWGTSIYSEYDEWLESSYADDQITCQQCHMKATGQMENFANPSQGGVRRNPNTVPSHFQLGTKDIEFMCDAISLETTAGLNQEQLTVEVTIVNNGAGHHYPTGNPMRNLILVVEVKDGDGLPLALQSGDTIPVWGGQGNVEDGNLAGLPGKGFAKVLVDLLPYPGAQKKWDFSPIYPAPHWRPTMIQSDNRIQAKGSDHSTYVFDVSSHPMATFTIHTRLIYRRSFKNWMNSMGLKLDDLELATNSLTLNGGF